MHALGALLLVLALWAVLSVLAIAAWRAIDKALLTP